MIYQRLLAILLLCIPGAAGIYGWKLMKNAIFDTLAGESFNWLVFVGGLILFCGGLFFLGGFLFYRDAKNNDVQPMLLPKKRKQQVKASGKGTR
ncbi:MAG: DUF2627 family protein [Firmicutes bacterium]|uniref:DUF2627 domain-containing protein n=1 Tax=Melghirimyces thermohalophilus TaxID=1236220 RepID=A0A1G6LK98_9BACL|nr:DUF2627 family protein [Melghirimyces thermohalophilus]MDA8351762.1 DUF2627 family protein [Bacillota bacterium]TMZ42133.1 DUF2627 family protein [Klebsiella pneumoniae]SDC43599.1 Protein of unknown function [Melghirimyces thermohalophilus]